MSSVSPSSSPRLPSPPPMAEDQIGPTSPGVSLFEDSGNYLSKPPRLSFGNGPDTGASRRIRPGTKSEDMAEGPPLVELQDIDSAFQLTEHLSALHNALTHPTPSTSTPITPPHALQLAQPPANTAREIWLYELARFLIQKTNSIIIALFTDTPPCSPQTCPEMRASEWQYLCAVHDPPKSCSAIDYCCHTLDLAASTLCNSKLFPSRLNLGAGAVGAGGGDKVLNQQMKELTSIFRRVYRIYAHAWFQHREVFWRVEGKTGLYGLFKTVCDVYGLIQHENYTIPPEAEGLEPVKEEAREQQQQQQVPSLLKRDDAVLPEPKGEKIVASGDTTKRHRHTMSSDSRASSVSTTITEEIEEDEEAAAAGGKPGLERAPTIIHADEAAAEPEPAKSEEVKEEVAEEPEMGISRSETVKPPGHDAEEVADEVTEPEIKAAEADETDPEITVVEAEIPEEEIEKEDVKTEEQESKIEVAADVKEDEGEEEKGGEKKDETVTEPAESGAADADEATKTVAD